MAKICGGDIAWIVCKRGENPGALPPFVALEGVLATEIGEEKIGGIDDGMRSL